MQNYNNHSQDLFLLVYFFYPELLYKRLSYVKPENHPQTIFWHENCSKQNGLLYLL